MDRRVLASVFVLILAAGSQARAAVDQAQASYDAAFALTRARNFDQAEIAWRNFLKQFPDHPLDGSAQYFLGETYFGRNDYQRAAATYSTGIEKYPKSDLAVETMLKLGISLGRAGQVKPACEAFRRLDREFPGASGVIREREIVERRHYDCPEEARQLIVPEPRPAPILAAAPGTTVTPTVSPTAPAAPLAAAPPAPAPATPPGAVASLEHGADAEPAPPAQPVIPVERHRLGSATEEEKAKARAELYVTPPPGASGKAGKAPARAAGTSGDTVKTTQILLAALDYDPGPVDGQMGTKLREAIRAFETKDGMRPDGEISDRLVQRLSFTLASRKAGIPAAAATRRIAGTGFVVSRAGYVLTSRHLVASCPDLRVRALGSEAVTPTLVASDAADDLALLRLKTPVAAAIRFRDGRGLRQGDPVTVAGLAPREEEVSDFYAAEGTVGTASGAGNELGLLKVTAALHPERGGAPVFDRAGQVVGVLFDAPAEKGAEKVAAKTKKPAAGESGLALRATIARNFLDAQDVDYESALSETELNATDLADRAKEVVVLVECRR